MVKRKKVVKNEPSAYQSTILNSAELSDGKGGIYKIEALAGSGKTSTAKMFLEQLPQDCKWHTLTFNTVIKDEWRAWSNKVFGNKNGPHTYCSWIQRIYPIHKWNWHMPKKFVSKSDYMRLFRLPQDQYTDDIISIIKDIVKEFSTNTRYLQINDAYMQWIMYIFHSKAHLIGVRYNDILTGANTLWNALCNPNNNDFVPDEYNGIKMMIIDYDKLEQLHDIQYFIWDEAQDIPDIHWELMLKMSTHSKHILFGDDYQSINLWRLGTSGMFNKAKALYQLPHTYRFGKPLAAFVNSFMRIMDDRGLKPVSSYMKCDNKDMCIQSYSAFRNIPIHTHNGTIAHLTRKNYTILNILNYYGKDIQKSYYIDSKYTKKSKMCDAFFEGARLLMKFKRGSIQRWYKYCSMYEIEAASIRGELTDTQQDIYAFMFNPYINIESIMNIEGLIKTNDKKKPSYYLTTTHQQKGAEHDFVIIANDFLGSDDSFEEHCIFNTAITRSKHTLYYPNQYEYCRKYARAAVIIEKHYIKYRRWKSTAVRILSNIFNDDIVSNIASLL